MLSGSELWLLRLMADRGRTLLSASSLLVVLEERGELQAVASSGETPRVSILPLRTTSLGELYRAGAPVAVRDPRADDSGWLRELGFETNSALAEPITMEPSGGLVIALRPEDEPFGSADVQALAAFAQSLAARLAAERSVELERLRHGLEARERERTRWAREIHDDTIQALGGLRMQLAGARDTAETGELRGAVEAAIGELDMQIDGLRHLITELRPAALDDLGLVPALEALARRSRAMDGLEVAIDVALPEDRRYDPELESVLYRVVQEALTNVAKHAHATQVTLRLDEREGRVRAAVTDDGRGLQADGDHERAPGSGFGLAGMEERAELVGGELSVAPAPAGGTTVELSVPLTARPAA